MNNIYIYLLIYLIVLFFIVYTISSKEKKEDYLIWWRNRNWWTIMFSKFAWSVWIAWFVSYTAYAYEFWKWTYILVLWSLIWYVFFAFFLFPRIYSISKENKFYTQWDLVFFHTNNELSKSLTNFISSLLQFLWLVIWIIWWAKIIDSLWLLNYELSLLLVILFTFLYVIIWWYKVVLITDIFQSFVIILILMYITYSLIHWVNIFEILSVETSNLWLDSIIWFFLFGIFSFLAMSDRYQLCYSAKNLKSIQNWIFLTFIPILFVASLLLFIWLYVHAKDPNLDSSIVFFKAMQFYLPSNLLAFWIVLFIAWLMSSSDTYIYAISSHISQLFSKNFLKKYYIKVVSIILMLFTFLFTYFFRDIVNVTIIAAWLSLTMSFPLIYIIYWWKNYKRFINSIIWWFFWFFFWLYIFGLEPSLALPVLLFWALFLIYNPKVK